MRLLEQLKQGLSGANFMTETRTEQSEWSRTTVRSAELIIETTEVKVQLDRDDIRSGERDETAVTSGNSSREARAIPRT